MASFIVVLVKCLLKDGNKMTKRILITGGAGFIGSNLCRRLVNYSDNKVIAMDNFCTGRRENIADLLCNERFTMLEHDIIEPLPDGIQV